MQMPYCGRDRRNRLPCGLILMCLPSSAAVDAMNELYRERGYLSSAVSFRGLTVDVTGHTAVADFDVEEGYAVCPRHGARIEICTGRPLSLPAVEPVETFPVKVEDGMVRVVLA